MRKLVTAVLAASLSVASVAAQAAPVERAAAPVVEANKMEDKDPTVWVIAVIALGVLLYALLDNGDPTSP